MNHTGRHAHAAGTFGRPLSTGAFIPTCFSTHHAIKREIVTTKSPRRRRRKERVMYGRGCFRILTGVRCKNTSPLGVLKSANSFSFRDPQKTFVGNEGGRRDGTRKFSALEGSLFFFYLVVTVVQMMRVHVLHLLFFRRSLACRRSENSLELHPRLTTMYLVRISNGGCLFETRGRGG